MRRGTRRLAVVLGVVALAALACVENISSPASCPDYCPGGQIVTVESVLAGAVVRDSSFSGYRTAQEAFLMFAATGPGLDSRPIFQTDPIATRLKIDTGSDTTTGPIVVDSARLTLTWLRRDVTSRNVRLEIYRLPLGLDSTSTLAGLAPSFGTPLRVVNLDSLLALPGLHDSITGDSILSRDTLRRTVVVSVKFDSAQAPYTEADSGKVAFGIRVTADSNASLVLGAADAGIGPSIRWFNRADSAGTLVAKTDQVRGLLFDSFVSNAPALTLDSNLTIGGLPETRALLRFAIPRNIRDSAQIIRATLVLTPAAPAPFLTRDSVFIQLNRMAADVGAKSPLVADTIGGRSAVFLPSGNDTLRVEITTMLRFWQFDTTAVTAAFVSLIALDRTDSVLVGGLGSGTTLTALRFFSSRSPAFQPQLRLTYVPRVKFGAP